MEKTSIHIGQADGISPEGDASGQGTVFTLTPWGREKVLYSFTGEMDGGNPISGLVFDAEGNLYGTTVEGGLFSFYGVVFELIPSGAEYVLYSFTGGTDGGEPYAGVIFDAQAALTAMAPPLRWRRQERSPSSTASAEESNCADGQYPVTGLIFDSAGNLYGTTSMGGGALGNGTVFKLSQPQVKSH
jgi:uncharacterized repeat protein (TIGR03803 family)